MIPSIKGNVTIKRMVKFDTRIVTNCYFLYFRWSSISTSILALLLLELLDYIFFTTWII